MGDKHNFIMPKSNRANFSSNLGNNLHFLLKWLRVIIFGLNLSGGVLLTLNASQLQILHSYEYLYPQVDMRENAGSEVEPSFPCIYGFSVSYVR